MSAIAADRRVAFASHRQLRDAVAGKLLKRSGKLCCDAACWLLGGCSILQSVVEGWWSSAINQISSSVSRVCLSVSWGLGPERAEESPKGERLRDVPRRHGQVDDRQHPSQRQAVSCLSPHRLVVRTHLLAGVPSSQEAVSVVLSAWTSSSDDRTVFHRPDLVQGSLLDQCSNYAQGECK